MSQEGLLLLPKRVNYQSLHSLNSNKYNEEILYKNFNKIKYKYLINESQANGIIKLPLVRVDESSTNSSRARSSNPSTSRSTPQNFTSPTRMTSTNEACQTPVEKTNTNVYYWYYRENGIKPNGSIKLPSLKKVQSKTPEDPRIKINTSSLEIDVNESKLSNYQSLNQSAKTKKSDLISGSEHITTDDEDRLKNALTTYTSKNEKKSLKLSKKLSSGKKRLY